MGAVKAAPKLEIILIKSLIVSSTSVTLFTNVSAISFSSANTG